MVDLYRIDLAAAAKEIGIDILISHDASRDGSHRAMLPPPIKSLPHCKHFIIVISDS